MSEGLLSGGVHAALDVLLATDLATVDSAVLLGELASLTVAANRLAAAQLRVLAAVESRRLDGDYGRTRTTGELLAAVAPMTAKAAAQRVETACALSPGRTLAGEPLPAMAPATAAACADGVVSPEQAGVIVETVRAALSKTDHGVAEVIEKTLLDACPTEHVHRLRGMAHQLLTAIDQNGAEPADPAGPDPRRGHSVRRRPNGLWRHTLDLDDPDHALVTAVLDSLSAPAPAPRSDHDNPAAAGGDRDPRSAAQRRADALIEALIRTHRSGTLPASGGAPVTVLVTVPLEQLITRCGVAKTDHGAPWPVPDLLAAARGEWALIPVLTDDAGAVLNLGRAQRLASTAQRRALAARDRGCCFPGCDRPPAYTQTHHIRQWRDGGETNLDNLCLLCTAHHRNFDAAGWSVRTGHDRQPEWLPPPWLDPAQHPRRNTSHRNPEPVLAH